MTKTLSGIISSGRQVFVLKDTNNAPVNFRVNRNEEEDSFKTTCPYIYSKYTFASTFMMIKVAEALILSSGRPSIELNNILLR